LVLNIFRLYAANKKAAIAKNIKPLLIGTHGGGQHGGPPPGGGGGGGGGPCASNSYGKNNIPAVSIVNTIINFK